MTTLTYSSWSYGRACLGKRAYTSRAEADQAATESARCYRQKRSAWSSYQCWHCNQWHCGHHNKRGGRRG